MLPSEQDRPDVARRRVRWKKYQARIDPARLVFIDETWAKTNMAPLRGWCTRGQRLNAKVPHGHWQTMTFLAALRHDRIDAPFVLEGPINGQSFRIYIEQVLLPTLKPGDVVILDNLGSQQRKGRARGNPIDGRKVAVSAALLARPSTQSSRFSPSSRRYCEKPPSARSRQPGNASATCSIASRLKNAPTTASTLVMLPLKLIAL